MAKILFGVHGTGHGHAIRALSVARQFPQHEFLFLSHGAGAALLRKEYPVVECPNPETPVEGHRVVMAGVFSSLVRVLTNYRPILRRVLRLLDRYQPDAVLSDYEFFLPRAAARAGLPCLSLDHEHAITCGPHPVPLRQFPSYLATSASVRFLFNSSSHFLATSFFRPRTVWNHEVRLVPPLLRESVPTRAPSNGEHVVAYQAYDTFASFFPFLSAIPRPVYVYGFNTEDRRGNLHFCKNSEERFLDHLASCHYVVCGGGHTLISEALFYGKPVFSFPVRGQFEQIINSFHVDHLGYGRWFTGFRPSPDLITDFEARVDHYRERIRGGRFYGNAEIFHLVDQFIRYQDLPI